jgi:two-component sensor histidine kinase
VLNNRKIIEDMVKSLARLTRAARRSTRACCSNNMSLSELCKKELNRLAGRWRAPNLILTVADDGTEIPAHRLKDCEGFGLQNMRQRVQDIGEKFEIQTATGRGTSIIVTVLNPFSRS